MPGLPQHIVAPPQAHPAAMMLLNKRVLVRTSEDAWRMLQHASRQRARAGSVDCRHCPAAGAGDQSSEMVGGGRQGLTDDFGEEHGLVGLARLLRVHHPAIDPAPR